MRDQLKAAGLMSEVFTFVDATHLIAKATLWEERDKARQQKLEQLNNKVLPKVAADKQARIGCKSLFIIFRWLCSMSDPLFTSRHVIRHACSLSPRHQPQPICHDRAYS
jgi:hypothetical protein